MNPTATLFCPLVLLLCYLFLLLILFAGSHRLIQQTKISDDFPFLSIIVAARNASVDFSTCLSALLTQDYPRRAFEVIVVDDKLGAITQDLLIKFSQFDNVVILQNSSPGKYRSSKKQALELAVSQARGEILLFTDADCFPAKNWARNMVANFAPSTGLVAGFSPQSAPGLVWNTVLALDAAAAAFVAAGAIAYGRGVTCTGRNLAYRKKALQDIGGFAALPDSLSGDDDFVLQAVSRQQKWEVSYSFDPETVVPAAGPPNLRAFLRQKSRHISAGKYYGRLAQAAFAFFHLLNLLMWGCALIGVFVTLVPLFFLALKFLADGLALGWFLGRYKMSFRLASFLWWEVIFLFYNAIIGPLAMMRKPKW